MNYRPVPKNTLSQGISYDRYIKQGTIMTDTCSITGHCRQTCSKNHRSNTRCCMDAARKRSRGIFIKNDDDESNYDMSVRDQASGNYASGDNLSDDEDVSVFDHKLTREPPPTTVAWNTLTNRPFTTAPRTTVARKGMVYRFGQSRTTGYPYKSNCSTRECKILHERFTKLQKQAVRNDQPSGSSRLKWLVYYINNI